MSFGKRWHNLNPYELHKTLINEYFLSVKTRAALLKRDASKDKRDIDVIRENHQFLWGDDADEVQTWEKKLAKKYYDKLFKEYCVADLSRYKENKVGLRWRTEHELVDGKGQFSCGSKRCTEKESLKTWEVNFGYVEHGIKKNALVKLRLCPACSHKLNYHHKKKEVKRLKHSHGRTIRKKERCPSESVRNDEQEESKSKVDSGNKNKEEVRETNNEAKESEIWKQTNTEEEEEAERKTREEEFDEYLDQLFL